MCLTPHSPSPRKAQEGPGRPRKAQGSPEGPGRLRKAKEGQWSGGVFVHIGLNGAGNHLRRWVQKVSHVDVHVCMLVPFVGFGMFFCWWVCRFVMFFFGFQHSQECEYPAQKINRHTSQCPTALTSGDSFNRQQKSILLMCLESTALTQGRSCWIPNT